MPNTTHCPNTGQLRRLIAGRADSAEQADLTRHLDDCSGCQRALEAMAGDGFAVPAPSERTPPPVDSAYWPALQQVRAEVDQNAVTSQFPAVADTDDELRLDFLKPARSPGLLGTLDDFQVVEVVGRGGMGVVLKALDPQLQRFVALKVLDPKFNDNPTARQRFCREARAAAAVAHENLVGVHTVSESNGLPYLVMPFVTGMSLQDRLDAEGALPAKSVIKIGAQVAAGLAAAHAQGLTHRDVKPANILLVDGGDAVKITDFGLARAAEDLKLTQTGFAAGTPLYMSPEQARGEELDPRTDLFSLGSVLYATCTGRAPFAGSTPFVVLHGVTEEEPPPIRALNPDVPQWLVAVIARLMAKKKGDRFQTAAEVAELLTQQLVALEQPSAQAVVCAARKSALRLTLSSCRSRAAAGFAAGLAVGVALWAVEVLGVSHFAAALADWRAGAESGVVSEPRATLPGVNGPVWAVAFSPTGDLLAMGNDDGSAKLFEPATGRVVATLSAIHKGPVWSLAFNKDGTALATASDDGFVRVWDVATRGEKCSMKHTGSVRAVAFSPIGKKVATGSRDGSVSIWDGECGAEVVKLAGHRLTVVAVAFTADGRTLLSGGGDRTVKAWDVETGTERVQFEGHGGAVYALAASADGQTLASGGWDRTVRLWDLHGGGEKLKLVGHAADVWGVAFGAGGKWVASGSEDRTVKLWDAATGTERATFRGHGGTVYAVAFSPDGKTLASGSRDGTVKLWDVPEK